MAAPLVLDSPHSGTIFPADHFHTCNPHLLRQGQDTLVDRLFAGAPGQGGTLLQALFARSYIDVNRALDDLDPQLIDGVWPEKLSPGEKSRFGMGLVRRTCRPGMPIYSRKLLPSEIKARIDGYYHPYHRQLAAIIAERWQQFGAVWHLNCHSMPSGAHGDLRRREVDFVLGDRDGTTCAPQFTRTVAHLLEEMGYKVQVNDPYRGVEIVRRYGAPADGVHSLQIEISRRLYLNEDTLAVNGGFETLQANLNRLIGELRLYCESQLLAAAAD
jgi:N-formylglutamate amidohydrolase